MNGEKKHNIISPHRAIYKSIKIVKRGIDGRLNEMEGKKSNK